MGHTMYITVLLQGVEYKFQLEFQNPSDHVIKQDYSEEEAKVTSFIVAKIKVVLPVIGRTTIGHLVLMVRNCDGVNEVRSRVWFGEVTPDDSRTVSSTFKAFANSYITRRTLFTYDFAQTIHKYICESMFCLRTFLPGMFAQRVTFYKKTMIDGQYESEFMTADGQPKDFVSRDKSLKHNKNWRPKKIVPVDVVDMRKIKSIDRWRRNLEKQDKKDTRPWREVFVERVMEYGRGLRDTTFNPKNIAEHAKTLWIRLTDVEAYNALMRAQKKLMKSHQPQVHMQAEGQMTAVELMMQQRQQRRENEKAAKISEGKEEATILDAAQETRSEEMKDDGSDSTPSLVKSSSDVRKKKQFKLRLVEKKVVDRPASLEGWVEKKTHTLIATFQKRYLRVNESTQCVEYFKQAIEIGTDATRAISFSMISGIDSDPSDPRLIHVRVPDGDDVFTYTFRAGSADEAVALIDGLSSWREYFLRSTNDEYREIVAV